MDELEEAVERWNAPTPPFFKKAQKIGVLFAALGGSVLAAPVALPSLMVTVAGYVLVAGSVLASVSQVAKQE